MAPAPSNQPSESKKQERQKTECPILSLLGSCLLQGEAQGRRKKIQLKQLIHLASTFLDLLYQLQQLKRLLYTNTADDEKKDLDLEELKRQANFTSISHDGSLNLDTCMTDYLLPGTSSSTGCIKSSVCCCSCTGCLKNTSSAHSTDVSSQSCGRIPSSLYHNSNEDCAQKSSTATTDDDDEWKDLDLEELMQHADCTPTTSDESLNDYMWDYMPSDASSSTEYIEPSVCPCPECLNYCANSTDVTSYSCDQTPGSLYVNLSEDCTQKSSSATDDEGEGQKLTDEDWKETSVDVSQPDTSDLATTPPKDADDNFTKDSSDL